MTLQHNNYTDTILMKIKTQNIINYTSNFPNCTQLSSQALIKKSHHKFSKSKNNYCFNRHSLSSNLWSNLMVVVEDRTNNRIRNLDNFVYPTLSVSFGRKTHTRGKSTFDKDSCL